MEHNQNEKHVKQIQENVTKYRSSSNSSKIFDQVVHNQLGEIFHRLDSKGRGKVSAQHINLEDIDVDILLIIKPLLVEMEKFNEHLNKEEFIESALNLFKTLDVNERNKILEYKRHKSFHTKPHKNSFQPQILKKSKEITE